MLQQQDTVMLTMLMTSVDSAQLEVPPETQGGVQLLNLTRIGNQMQLEEGTVIILPCRFVPDSPLQTVDLWTYDNMVSENTYLGLFQCLRHTHDKIQVVFLETLDSPTATSEDYFHVLMEKQTRQQGVLSFSLCQRNV